MWACTAAAVLCLSPAAATENPDRYNYCTYLAATDPVKALDHAADWVADTEADAAQHCLALALLGLGQYDRAAEALDHLAATMTAPPHVIATLHAKAGEAWLMADAPDRAQAAFARALELAPDDPDRIIDQARADAAAGQYEDALALLGDVLAVHPDRADALIFRAVTWRQLELPDEAAADLDRALALDPANPDALLERAILWLARDDVEQARRDFGAVILSASDSPAAALAREYLATLDEVGDLP